MSVNGKGNPSENDMLAVATDAGLQTALCKQILQNISQIARH